MKKHQAKIAMTMTVEELQKAVLVQALRAAIAEADAKELDRESARYRMDAERIQRDYYQALTDMRIPTKRPQPS